MIHKILVIDDHDGWLEALKLYLERHDYQVHTAQDWYIANRLASQNQYDLIISDNQMGEDRNHWGVNILPRLKHRQDNVKTILISLEPVENSPADLFILKELVMEELIPAIGRLNLKT